MRLRKEDKKNLGIGLLVGGILAVFLPAKFNPFVMVKNQINKMGGSQ